MFATIYFIPLDTTTTQQWATNTNSTVQKIINFIQQGVLLINYHIVLSLGGSHRTSSRLAYILKEEVVDINVLLLFFQSQFYTVYILWKSNPKIFFLSTFAKFTSYCSSHYNANPFCKGWFTSFIHIPFYTYSGLFQSFQK